MPFWKLNELLDSPFSAHILPWIFIGVSLSISIPQLIIHVLLHPLTYLPLDSKNLLALRRKMFFYFWSVMGPALNAGDEKMRQPLLQKCHGTVLEIGCGVGDNIKLYDRSKVKRLILVEPNTSMHEAIRKNAAESGYHEADGSLLLLGCGGAASDATALELAGVGPNSVDCISSIHVLCGIPSPATAIEMYRRILKPGGILVFYEHVRADKAHTAHWQAWYTRNIWQNMFDGCCLDRPTGDWIIRGPDGDFGVGLGGGAHLRKGMANGESSLVSGRWKEYQIAAPEGQPKHTLLPHVKGWAIKA